MPWYFPTHYVVHWEVLTGLVADCAHQYGEWLQDAVVYARRLAQPAGAIVVGSACRVRQRLQGMRYYSRAYSAGAQSVMLTSCPSVEASNQGVADSPPAELANLEVTERFLRDLVKSEIPRLVRSRSRVLLVEEMEVCLGRARVDLAVIADHLIGIEIKGPKDDVTRLPGQVLAYSKCFDRIVLVVDESLAKKARLLVPAWWGLVIGLQREGEFSYQFERRPRPNPDLDMDAFLSLLWRDEIDALLADLLGASPKPRATKKTIRAELLARIELPILHCASLNKLRNRSDWRSVPVHGERGIA